LLIFPIAVNLLHIFNAHRHQSCLLFLQITPTNSIHPAIISVHKSSCGIMHATGTVKLPQTKTWICSHMGRCHLYLSEFGSISIHSDICWSVILLQITHRLCEIHCLNCIIVFVSIEHICFSKTSQYSNWFSCKH
jgi:hypothetical protein